MMIILNILDVWQKAVTVTPMLKTLTLSVLVDKPVKGVGRNP